MEFWGVEVPAGKPTLCSPGGDVYLHMTQAALGESKSGSGNDRVVIRVKVGDIEVVLGTLSQGKCDQMAMDLIFETDFSIFHNGSSSVYLSGYKTEASGEEYPSDEDESEEDEELEPGPLAVTLKTNGDVPGGRKAVPVTKTDVITQEAAVEAGKIAAAQAKKKLEKHVKTPVVAEVDEDDEEDEDDDDDDDDESDDEMATPGEASPFFKDVGSDSDEDDESFDGDMEDDDSEEISDDDEDDEDDSDDEDEMQFEVETPTPKSGKKRAASATPKNAEKKVRMDTPARPGLGSNGDKKMKPAPATPVAKTPEKEQKTPKDKKGQPKTPTIEKAQTPKGTPVSGKKLGDHKCTACDKNFATEVALTQHSTAKHKVKA